MDAAGRDGPHGGQGLRQGCGRLGRVDPDVEILALDDRLEMPGDERTASSPATTAVAVDLQVAQARAAAASARSPPAGRPRAGGRSLRGRSHEGHPGARAIEPLEPGETSTAAARACGRLHREGDPARIEVDAAQDLGVRVVGVDDRQTPRHDLAEQLRPWPVALRASASSWKPQGAATSVATAAWKAIPSKLRFRSDLAETSTTPPLQPHSTISAIRAARPAAPVQNRRVR